MNYGSISESIYNYRVENGRTYHAVCTSFPTLFAYFMLKAVANETHCSTAVDVSIHQVRTFDHYSYLSAPDPYVLPNDEVRQDFLFLFPTKQLMT